MSTLWYPYTQMKTSADPYQVVGAEGVNLFLNDGRMLIDAVSSWWCVIHGYNHPEITRAAQKQVKRLSHVMLGGLTHRPALELSERLVTQLPTPLRHVFFSDSGSVGVEVALKMAIQFWKNKHQPKKQKILSFKKSYHGDTTGAMAVSDPWDSMHSLFSSILPSHYFMDAPGESELSQWTDALLQRMEENHQEIAAVIIEPLVQCAGGFNIYGPDYLSVLRAACDRFDILLIFDEVATGFGRTGSLFAFEQADVCPDILVLGKGLTGGYLGMAATVARSQVFDAFLSDDPAHAFMHGPTFMGNPLACQVAIKSFDIFLRDRYLDKIRVIERLLTEQLLDFTHPKVRDTRIKGALGVIDVFKEADLQGIQGYAAERGVWLRPFGTYLYTMPAYTMTPPDLLQICTVMKSWFSRK